jgi:transcriptional regulator with XRE-family HTH domain
MPKQSKDFKAMNKDLLVQVGRNIKLAREGKMTQEELAFAIDLHPNFLGVVENGHANISIIHLYNISKALKITLSDLVKNIVIPKD